ncbi:MAG TPA: hypothetical protein VJT73_05055 [Polyangiaceae bacterium]|nr:hypothetical protein [Polyangiaceae bacterium]
MTARISIPVARRLDRQSRYAHRFHRFAHHPLCDEYEGEVLKLGRRTRICRGCAFAAAGAMLGSVSVALSRSTLAVSPHLVFTICFVAWSWVAIVTLRAPRGRLRVSKVASRMLPAATIAFGVGHALVLGRVGYALVSSNVGLLALISFLYRQKGPHRSPCATCPERLQATPCRGVMPIVRRERAFRRLAARWLATSES